MVINYTDTDWGDVDDVLTDAEVEDLKRTEPSL